MDVHVHIAVGELDEEISQGLIPRDLKPLVCGAESRRDDLVPHPATVDKEILASSILSMEAWVSNESRDGRRIPRRWVGLDLEKALGGLLSQELPQSVPQALGRREIKDRLPPVAQAEVNAGKSQGKPGELLEGVRELGAGGPEKLAARRHVVKEAPDVDGRARFARRGLGPFAGTKIPA